MTLPIPLVALLMLLSSTAYAEGPATRPVDAEAALARLRVERPRLIALPADFERARQRADTEPAFAADFERLIDRADALLETPASVYEKSDGVRLLPVSRRVVARTYDLATAWRMTGDRRYADRLWRELDAAAGFPEWNPPHFLDTAEMTHAFAIGLDWAHDAWTPQQRERLRDAIVDKGLMPGLALLEEGVWWHKDASNWNIVCHGGLLMGALAVADERPDLAATMLAYAAEGMPHAIATFAPDGGHPEGPGYWHFAMRYLVPTLASMRTAVGTELGLADQPGLAEAGWFAIHVTSPSGPAFNFADSKTGRPNTGPLFYWLADRFDEPAFAAYAIQLSGTGDRPLDLLWRPTDVESLRNLKQFGPTLRHFEGIGAVFYRSGWGDPSATYLATQFGRNRVGHNQADLGSFVFDAGGTRWFMDFGRDSYSLPGYFGPERYAYYRNRSEGHNVPLVDPDAAVNQDVDAGGELIALSESDGGMVLSIDLTPAYAHRGVDRVTRQFEVDEGRLVVDDVVRLAGPGTVRWHFHTEATVEVGEDGRSARLRRDGRTLRLELASPAEARLLIEPAGPLPTSPTGEGQDANAGVTRLAVVASGGNEARLTLRIRLEG